MSPSPLDFDCPQCGKPGATADRPGEPCTVVADIKLYHHLRWYLYEDAVKAEAAADDDYDGPYPEDFDDYPGP